MSVWLKNSGMAKENTRIQISDKYSSTQWKPGVALPKAGPEKYYNKVWEGSTQKFTDHLSIDNWVLYKRDLESEDSYLKFIIKREKKMIFFKLHFMQLFSANATIFLRNFFSQKKA